MELLDKCHNNESHVASVGTGSGVTSADGLEPGPLLAPVTPPHALPDDHVAVVALVGDQGVVGHRVEHHATKGGMRGSGAGDGWNSVTYLWETSQGRNNK